MIFLRKILLIHEKHPPFGCIYTKSFALIREKYNFFLYGNESIGFRRFLFLLLSIFFLFLFFLSVYLSFFEYSQKVVPCFMFLNYLIWYNNTSNCIYMYILICVLYSVYLYMEKAHIGNACCLILKLLCPVHNKIMFK